MTIIYAYFVVCFVIIHSEEAILLGEKDSYRDAVDSYFLCEAVGHVKGRCSRESFEQYSHPLLEIIHYLILLFFPIVTLLYLINCRNLKKKAKEMKFIKVLRSFPSNQKSTSLSTS